MNSDTHSGGAHGAPKGAEASSRFGRPIGIVPKLMIPAIIPVLALLTSFGVFWHFDQETSDGPVRQFIAGQANVRLLVLELQIAASHDPGFTGSSLNNTVRQIEESFQLIEKGGVLDEKHVIKPLSAELSADFLGVRTSWDGLKPHLEVLSETPPSDPEFEPAYIQALVQLQTLENASTHFASVSEQRAFNLREDTKSALLVTLFLTLLVLSATARAGFLRLVRPILSLDETAKRVAAGDYSTSFRHHSNDEIGRFAATFAKMTARVGTLVEELQASHVYLNTLIDTVPVNLCIVDQTGAIQSSNLLWRETFENESQLGQNLVDTYRASPGDTSAVALAEAIEAVVHRGITNHSAVFKQGGQIYQTQIVPLGQSGDVLIAHFDITSVKVMEDQLNQARRLEAIGQLSAGIAHEINTPMQYIGDNIQFLERATSMLIQMGDEVEKLAENHDDEDMRTMFANWLRVGRFGQLKSRVPTAFVSAKEGVLVVSQIVQAMKAFAHPGDRELKLADLNSAITNTITVSRNEWKYVADIDTEFADFCAVKCNLGELNQVFLNIIVNAAHAISDTLDDTRRMGRIKISTHDDVDHIEVRIADDGTGMPEEVKARIFEQFFTTKAVGSGTGQGLALAHAVIVDRHKGTIKVDSAPGKGTTFRIRIPKVSEDAEAA